MVVVAVAGGAVASAVFGAGALGTTKTLPPGTLRGPAHLLQQYPAMSLATPAQRRAAKRLLTRTIAGTRRWRDADVALTDGFATDRARQLAPNAPVGIFHAEHRGFRNDGRTLDTRRPETLIYANAPGHPLVLIGVMYGVPRGVHGPTPGGAITRWHRHSVCAQGKKRGTTPRSDGSCPPGTKRRLGSEMLHIWFTRDLRSAYAIHAPEPELCRDGLYPPERCRGHQHHHHG
jgi:hypothetical protein